MKIFSKFNVYDGVFTYDEMKVMYVLAMQNGTDSLDY